MRYLTDAIGEIVRLMNVDLTDELFYTFGSFKELQKLLIDKSKEQEDRYPLLFLLLDLEEEMESEGKNVSASSQTYILLNSTNKAWTSTQRMENQYKTVLYPLYESFINTIKSSIYFLDSLDEYNNLPHIRKDRFYYSSTDAKEQNVLSAYLDAIEINNLELKLSQEVCLPAYGA